MAAQAYVANRLVVSDGNHRMDLKSSGAVEAGASLPSLEQQERYWEYWQATRSMSGWGAKRAEVVLKAVEKLELDHPRILDFGCGTGWFTEELARFGNATGIDLSRRAMQEASERSPHIRFIRGDLFEYPLEHNAYDIIVSMNVIAHVEDQPRFMDRAADLLKVGGHLILTTNNKFVMERQGNLGLASHSHEGHIEKWLSARDLRRLVSPRFKVKELQTLLPLGNGGILRVINSVRLETVAALFGAKESLVRLKERLGLGYYIVLVARKL